MQLSMRCDERADIEAVSEPARVKHKTLLLDPGVELRDPAVGADK